DSGLDLIELQITDGSMYLDPAGNLVSTPAWVTPTGLENWSFDISTVTFPKGTYTITARATDKAGNIGTGSLITVYSGDRVFSTLNVFVNTHRILQGDPLSVAGQIKRHPAKDTAGVWIDLREESVGILISNENNPNVFSGTALTDDLGNYYFDIPNDILTEKGTHTVAIDFTGSGTLHAAQTVTENVLVGNSAGYAILLQGKTNDEEGMASYDKSLTRIYDALLRRQFIKDDIRYFNYDHPRPDTSGVPAKQAIRDTLTAWACDRISGTPAPLYLVMMDHGNPEAFYLGDETITPEELNTWFEELESCLTSPAALEEPRVTIIGACYSGSFIPDLSGDGRTIISSSTAFEVSYKGIKEADDIRGGEFFVDELFVQLERGLSLRDAFEYAVAMTEIFTRSGQVNASTANPFQDDAMQHPLMDDNHDGAGSNILRNSDDGDKAAELYLGAGTDFVNSLGGSADIERITPAGFLRANQSSTPLWLEAYDASQVAVAIVEIRPPSKILYTRENTGQIDIELDNRLLLPVPDSNRFELPYTDFAESGRYEILYKVVDRDTGAVSPVWRSLVYKDKLDNMPPYPFTLSVPANDAETRTVLGLSWENNGDPDNDPVSYTLEIANDFNFNEIVHSQQEVTSALTYVDDNAGLEDGSRYYWRVIATDFYGASTPSRIRTFNTNNPSDSFRCIDVNTYDGVYSNPVECPTLNFDPPLLTQATALTDCQAGRTLLCGEFDRSAIITEHPDYQPVTSPFDTQPGQITPINVQLLPSCPPTCASPGTLEFSLDNKLSVTEGNERIIYVSRDNGTDTDISVAYTVGGTAVAGNDYEIAGSNMLTWPDTDARNKPIRIATIDDDRYEKNETITLELSNSFGGAEIGAYFKITVTVEDNDPPVFGQLQFPETLLTVTESQDSAAISVERIGGTDGPVSVEYMIVNGSTAAQDQDYQLSGILNFASGQSTAELTLSLLPDLIPEGEELLGIQLINPTGGAELGDNQQLIVTIQDDDPPPTISFSQSAYQLNENDGVASITLRRDSAHGTATLDYSTRDQTARAGSHYMAVQGSVFFGESETEKTIHIKIYKVTGDKNFVLQLARSDNAVLEANEVEIIIKDNPPPPPRDPVRPGVLAFSASILNIAESQKNIRIPIMRTLGADGSVSVEYRILSSGSTATEGEDFQLNDPQRIAFQAGQSMAEVNVTILDDQRFEAEETLALELVTPEGGAKLGNLSRMTLTIADDDTNTIQWELPDVRVREDSGNIQVAVTRTLAQGIATAYYKTQDGSARAGTDYIAAEGVVFFASGKMQASVSITVLDNQAADGMKTFSVLLSDPEGAVLGNTDSTDIAIFDNEGGTIQFSAPGYSARQEQGVVAVTLIRAEAAGAAAWVDYQTQDGSAQAGTDFIAAKDIAFFPEGKTEANIFIHLLPNPASSGLKTFTLHLSNPVGVDLDEFGSTEISITNEVLPKGSIHFTETHYSVIEEGQGVVNLEREGGTAGEVCVTFSTGLSNHPDAPASLEDFIPIEQQNVCWADGENGIKTVKVKTSADQLEENDELVELRITAANPEALGSPRRATLIIKDPTARKDILYFLQIAYSVAEANAVLEIPVLRSGAGLNAVEVEYATVSLDGVIAERDRDYRHQNGSLRWEKGDIEKKIIRLEILDDNVWEEDEETLYILLSDPANGASLQNASKVKIIIAADQYPNLGNGVVAFGAAGTTAGFFGGSSIGEAEYQAVLLLPGPEHSGAKKLNILAKLTPDSEHHGAIADILAVVGYTHTHSFALEDECWTEAIAMNVRMVTAAPEGLTFPCWDSNPDTLQPYKNNVLLESSHIIKLYDGPLPPGLQAYQVYFGYRLADGTVIFNGEQTIHASTLP
ncbi:MAG: hypothetical protein GY862_21505, partial [Gammaproteobacteria bacterium]|nr:hypothetical protein [Gammaproteobacteria bacterium]